MLLVRPHEANESLTVCEITTRKLARVTLDPPLFPDLCFFLSLGDVRASAYLRRLYQSFQPSITRTAKASEMQSHLQCPLFCYGFHIQRLDQHQRSTFSRQMDTHTFCIAFSRCQSFRRAAGHISMHKQPVGGIHKLKAGSVLCIDLEEELNCCHQS